SRAPGHPVQEYICSLFWQSGPVGLNGATAVMSVMASLFFILILKKLGFKNVYLPALAFAFTPVIYINSVNSMDNLWNLAFILASLYFVMRNNLITAGIMLGLANGCRLTSVILTLPFLILIYYYNKAEKPKKILIKLLIFASGAVVVTFISYIPGLLKFGKGLFTDVAWAYPGIFFIAFRLFIATWGLIGFSAIVIVCIIELAGRINLRKSAQKKPDWYFDISLWIAIIFYIIIFMMMPHKPSYLVPLIPMLLILLGRFLSPKFYRFVCISLIISPFLLGVYRTELDVKPETSDYVVKIGFSGSDIFFDPINGPILTEHSKRINQLEFRDKILAEGSRLKRKSVVVIGEAYPFIIVTLPAKVVGGKVIDYVQGNVIYEYSSDSTKLNYYMQNGYDIYYLPGEEAISLQLYGVDLKSYGTPIFPATEDLEK
ncbi:MAG: hypothetical protein L0Y77_04310, partial [Chlorobi bacterium]|nr:hypothetical protein [Chlorobiota bacterium]